MSLTLLILLISLVTGLVAGVIAGLFGVGGGIIIVPALLMLFHLVDLPSLHLMQLAVGTSLATIVVTNTSTTWHHHRRQSVSWPHVRHTLIGTLPGAWIGAHVASHLTSETLRLLFGFFLMMVGTKMALDAYNKSHRHAKRDAEREVEREPEQQGRERQEKERHSRSNPRPENGRDHGALHDETNGLKERSAPSDDHPDIQPDAPVPMADTLATPQPAPWQMALALMIGIVSSLFGIGGGTMLVPAVTLLAKLPIRMAVGTSSAVGSGIALAGAIGFIQAGLDRTDLPDIAFGYLIPPAFFGIILGTLITTPVGVRLAHSWSPALLQGSFALFMLIVAGKLIGI